MIRRLSTILLAAALLAALPAPILATDPSLPAPPSNLAQTSIHAEMLATEGAGHFSFARGGEPTVLLDSTGAPTYAPGVSASVDDALLGPAKLGATSTATALPNGLRKQIFGFLPYWMLDDTSLASMNYSLVSTIAYFGVAATATGDLVQSGSGLSGWNSTQMTQVIDRAHSYGVKVVLTVTMMAWDSTSAQNQADLLNHPARQTRLVGQIVAAIRDRHADGVNLDFEPVASSLSSKYVALVRELKQGLTDAGVGNNLTVCVTASAATWASGYDIPGLTASGAADDLFVMGYDYNWSGSSRAGGVAPIQSPYTLDVDGTMQDFLKETTGNKLIWGVPYYGRTWPTSSGKVNAATLGGGSASYYYTGHLKQADQYGRRWDDVGQVPWYRYQKDGHWVEGYYDDVTSLGIKYDLILARGLAGTGMWTLLMDQGRDELWSLLADKFVDDSAPPVGGITLLPDSVDAETVHVSWRAVDYASGVKDYTVQVSRDGGSWTTWLSDTTRTDAWFTGVAGSTYTFRLQAVDWKGNAQAWTTVPDKPATVSPGAFASVSVPTLNVRSGAGTDYGIVATISAPEPVYVLEGPVSGSGYDWYLVQYGFAEWPSSTYAQYGWVAIGSSSETYLQPADPPTRTTLNPFISGVHATRFFSPNGDGQRDRAAIHYTLAGPADDVTIDLLSASGTVVRSLHPGAQAAGDQLARWNGRTDGGAVAAEGRYLARVTAATAGGTEVAPVAEVNADALARYGITLDVTAPRLKRANPSKGRQLVPSWQNVQLDFSERVRGGSIRILAPDGSVLPAVRGARNGGRRIVLDPADPFRAGTRLRISVSRSLHDRAGNPFTGARWAFRTAPGTVYDPPRGLAVERGHHVGFRIGSDGQLKSPKRAWFSSSSSALAAQRSRLRNLPGTWIWVKNGVFGGRWLRESSLDHLLGVSHRKRYPDPAWVSIAAGTHVGLRFDADGNVTDTRSYRLTIDSGAPANQRAIINGQPYLHITAGIWRHYWLPESSLVDQAGFLERHNFPGLPRVSFTAGTYVGYAFDADGNVTDRVSYTLTSSSSANAKAWAVINGVPRFLIANGIWAGTWIAEDGGPQIAY